MTGWTVGGGLEAAIGKDWLARAAYRYADFGSFAHTFFAGTPLTFDAVHVRLPISTHTVEFGFAYRFGG
jgi:outer membrane immunogenic protein